MSNLTLQEIYAKHPFIEKLTEKECSRLVAELLIFMMQISLSKENDEEKEKLFEDSIIGMLKDAAYLKIENKND